MDTHSADQICRAWVQCAWPLGHDTRQTRKKKKHKFSILHDLVQDRRWLFRILVKDNQFFYGQTDFTIEILHFKHLTISVPRMTCTIYFKYSERAIIKRSIPYTKKVSSIIHVNPQSTCYHKKVWSLKKYYWLWDVKSQTNHQDTFCFVKNIQRNIVMHSFKKTLKAEH